MLLSGMVQLSQFQPKPANPFPQRIYLLVTFMVDGKEMREGKRRRNSGCYFNVFSHTICIKVLKRYFNS